MCFPWEPKPQTPRVCALQQSPKERVSTSPYTADVKAKNTLNNRRDLSCALGLVHSRHKFYRVVDIFLPSYLHEYVAPKNAIHASYGVACPTTKSSDNDIMFASVTADATKPD